ncbi:major facilitator superfamily domain-containing protein [Circinella umbellata]|nr:major facilitator superfamily domain-containing protein [Circinella umbellata]
MDSTQTRIHPLVIFCSIVASMGTFNAGINTSALNIPGYFVRNCPNVDSSEITYFPGTGLPECIPMNDFVWGIATGMLALGGLVGAIIAGRLAKYTGRRDTMFIINSTFFIGAILMGSATTSAMLIIGRIFAGIGSGSMSVLVSMYIAEIAPPKQRGMLVGLLQLFATCGFLVIELCGLGLQSAIGWRISSVITVIPALLQIILLPFCVRSPRWLINQNRVDEAYKALSKLRQGDIDAEFNDMTHFSSTSSRDMGKNVEYNTSFTLSPPSLSSSTNNENVIIPYQQEQLNYRQQSDNSIYSTKKSLAITLSSPLPVKEGTKQRESLSLIQLVNIPVLAKLTFKMIILHAGFQLCGILAIMYYSTSIFQTTFDGNYAAYVTVGVSGVFVIFTMIGLILVDRLGRKALILFSSVTMCISCILMTVALTFDKPIFQVVCIMLFVATFAVGLGICPFLFASESFPTYAIDAGCSAALMSNWFFNFAMGLLFPTLMKALDVYVFVPFAVITFLLAIFTYFFTVETAGKSIDEIGRELGWYDLELKKFSQKK